MASRSSSQPEALERAMITVQMRDVLPLVEPDSFIPENVKEYLYSFYTRHLALSNLSPENIDAITAGLEYILKTYIISHPNLKWDEYLMLFQSGVYARLQLNKSRKGFFWVVLRGETPPKRTFVDRLLGR